MKLTYYVSYLLRQFADYLSPLKKNLKILAPTSYKPSHESEHHFYHSIWSPIKNTSDIITSKNEQLVSDLRKKNKLLTKELKIYKDSSILELKIKKIGVVALIINDGRAWAKTELETIKQTFNDKSKFKLFITSENITGEDVVTLMMDALNHFATNQNYDALFIIVGAHGFVWKEKGMRFIHIPSSTAGESFYIDIDKFISWFGVNNEGLSNYRNKLKLFTFNNCRNIDESKKILINNIKHREIILKNNVFKTIDLKQTEPNKISHDSPQTTLNCLGNELIRSEQNTVCLFGNPTGYITLSHYLITSFISVFRSQIEKGDFTLSNFMLKVKKHLANRTDKEQIAVLCDCVISNKFIFSL